MSIFTLPPEVTAAVAAIDAAISARQSTEASLHRARDAVSVAEAAKRQTVAQLDIAETALALAENRTPALVKAADEARARLSEAEREVSRAARVVAHVEGGLPALDPPIEATADALDRADRVLRCALGEVINHHLGRAAVELQKALCIAHATTSVLPGAGAFANEQLIRRFGEPHRPFIAHSVAIRPDGERLALNDVWRADPDAAQIAREIEVVRTTRVRLHPELQAVAARRRKRDAAAPAPQAAFTISRPQSTFRQPSEQELRRLFAQVNERRPDIMEAVRYQPNGRDAEWHFQAFALAYERIGNLARSGQIDALRDARFYADECENWAAVHSHGNRRVSTSAFIAAALAHGVNIEFGDPLHRSTFGFAPSGSTLPAPR